MAPRSRLRKAHVETRHLSRANGDGSVRLTNDGERPLPRDDLRHQPTRKLRSLFFWRKLAPTFPGRPCRGVLDVHLPRLLSSTARAHHDEREDRGAPRKLPHARRELFRGHLVCVCAMKTGPRANEEGEEPWVRRDSAWRELRKRPS